MSLLEDSLAVKRSALPGAGKGLFTMVFIPKNTRIVEYKGKLTTWKDAKKTNGNNAYLFYVNRNHVIDARPYKKSKARYANDARGLKKIKGLANNAEYVEQDGKVYIKAKKNIGAGKEIFVSYGKEYWEAIRYNKKHALK